MSTTKPLYQILLISFYCLSSLISNAQTKETLITTIAEDIQNNYINQSLARQIADSLMAKWCRNEYDTTILKDAFLYQILKDIRRYSNDKHFFLAATPKQAPKKQNKPFHKTFIDHFYYSQIQIWDERIAYIAFDNFQNQLYPSGIKQGRRPIHRVLESVRSLDTIVIDLRYNRGGKAYMGAYWLAHFLAKPAQYLFTTVEYSKNRKNKIQTDFKTPAIQIEPLLNKKIYVLTSQYTFSTAELVVYILKKYIPRVEIIGEQTAGGANGHLGKQYREGYQIQIPSFRVVDKKNANYSWEGVGVQPDVYAPVDSALLVLTQRIRKEGQSIQKTKVIFNQLKSVRKLENTEPYVGTYTMAKIIAKNGCLYIQYDIKPPTLLIPKQKTTVFRTLEFKAVWFEQHENQVIKGIYIKHHDGYTAYYKKNKH